MHYVFDPALFLAIVGTVSNVVIAAFTVVVCFIYKRQHETMTKALEETRASNEIAGRSLELGRRAWIVVNGAPMFRGSAGWVFWDVTVENVSEMPAIIQRYGSGRVEGNPDTLELEKGQQVKSAEVLVGGKEINLEIPAVPPPPFNIDNQAATWGDVQAAMIYCFVEYTDCFEITWRSTICWKEDSSVGGWRKVGKYTSFK